MAYCHVARVTSKTARVQLHNTLKTSLNAVLMVS